MTLTLKVKRLTETAKLPTYAHDGDACFDIYSDGIEEHNLRSDEYFEVHSTGLSFDFNKDYVMLVFGRSGMAFKQNARLANCVAVIDSNFRGELKIKVTFDGYKNPWEGFKKGDRIAQAMLIPVHIVAFEEVDSLSDSERGEGGFGSSGK